MGIVGSALRSYLEGREAASSPATSAGKSFSSVPKQHNCGHFLSHEFNASLDFRTKLIHYAGSQSGEIKTNGKSDMKAEAAKSEIEKLKIRACSLMNTRGSPGLQVR